jgi:hypothetical protein
MLKTTKRMMEIGVQCLNMLSTDNILASEGEGACIFHNGNSNTALYLGDSMTRVWGWETNIFDPYQKNMLDSTETFGLLASPRNAGYCYTD